ncbi:hypothetical protein [Vibrio stylophorae]|uniref:hypothetical protein n=1 Tax=Vibrio stylophorae TaxID=659351 RepID=UPI001F25CA1C|nr:hypothetical protein [Vibrio stylophorae]
MPQTLEAGVLALLATHSRAQILAVMAQLLPDYQADEEKTQAYRGSGTGGEMHMAACMRLSYLEKCIALLS